MTSPFPPTGGADDNAPAPLPGAAWAPPNAPTGPTLPPSVPPPPGSGMGGTMQTPMIHVESSTAAAPGRSRGKTIGALVGVTALLAAGAFAVVSIAGNDESGGAATPTEVGTQLTAALDNEDLLGVIDLLLPGERDTFRDPIIRTVDNLIRLQVLADDTSLSGISGVDIKFSDVTVREEATNVDDIVNIFLSGSSTASVDGNEVPIGDLLLDEVFDGERPDLPTDPETGEFDDVQMTVVQRDGRWYLSAFYSIAEQARDDRDVPAQGVQAAGADDPELAIDQMLDAISDQDLEALIAVLDPTEAEALQRYAPLFLDEAQSELDDAGIPWSIDDRAYSVEGSGGRRTVDITSFTFTVSEPNGDGEFSARYADGCLTVSLDGEEVETCGVGDGDLGDLADDMDLGDNGAVTDLLDTLGAAFDDYDPSGIGVHQVDGKWYVSPISTGFDAWNDVLDALDRDEVNDVIDAIKALGDIEDIGVLPGLIEDETGLDTGFDTDTIDTIEPGTLDTLFPTDTAFPTDTVDPGEGDEGDDIFAALDACRELPDVTAGVQCLQAGIADGSIDPIYVGAPLLFPECGAADAYWDAIYTMPDADFAALVTQTSPCFLALVSSGELDPFMLPSEFFDPTCLEGLNWYTNFEQDYNDRFYACTDAARDTYL